MNMTLARSSKRADTVQPKRDQSKGLRATPTSAVGDNRALPEIFARRRRDPSNCQVVSRPQVDSKGYQGLKELGKRATWVSETGWIRPCRSTWPLARFAWKSPRSSSSSCLISTCVSEMTMTPRAMHTLLVQAACWHASSPSPAGFICWQSRPGAPGFHE